MADSVCTEVLCLKAKQISSVYIPYQESHKCLSLIALLLLLTAALILNLAVCTVAAFSHCTGGTIDSFPAHSSFDDTPNIPAGPREL